MTLVSRVTVGLLLAISGNVLAGEDSVTYSIVPLHPSAGEMVRLRMDVVGCFEADVISAVDNETRVIEVEVHSPDYCDEGNPDATSPLRFWDIGTLAVGQYVARIVDCGGPVVPPQPTCVVRSEQLLVVRGMTGPPAVVPMLSRCVLLMLLVLALLTGLRALPGR